MKTTRIFKIFHPISNLISYLKLFYLRKLSFIWSTIIFNLSARLFGVDCINLIKCYGKVYLFRYPLSSIVIGNNVLIISNPNRASACTIYSPTKIQTLSHSANIQIGSDVGLNGTSIVARSKKISIGSGTMIASNVVILDSDYHVHYPPENRLTNPGFEFDADVIIGNNVWIGVNSIILKGVNIGDGSIIGAGSVVVNNIPSGVIAAGNPARVIKTLC